MAKKKVKLNDNEFDVIGFGTLALRMENNQEAIKEIIKKAFLVSIINL